MIKIPSEVKYLSYAGIIPILMGLVGSFDFNLVSDNFNNWLVEFGLLFSALILSFLGGCIFIFEISFNSKFNFKGILLSMFPSIWAALSLQIPMTCFLLAIGFLATLERERYLARIIELPKWWLKMRFRLTTLIVLLLIIMGFNV